MITLKKGSLAYFAREHDHLLLKCKVVRVDKATRQDDKVVGHVVARITTYRSACPDGLPRFVTSETVGQIIPREAYRPGQLPLPFEKELDQ